ncbi:hypothetical protein LCGC14_2255890 [marine sediment metagenome]|uniref:Uncharacterized protein n=1 Tax=marine sediment metagenome TaxID=412755 RepID=A0A0F9DNM1_9ZZZZ|nr:hypothetical protein [Porticoccus sp.]
MPDPSHKLVVRPYKPDNRKREIALWLLLAGAIFFVGVLLGMQLFDQAMVDKRQQADELEVLQVQLDEVSQKRVNAELASDVDRIALEHVRQLVTSLQSEMAVDEEELGLYRNLLQEGGSESGLLIGALMLKQHSEQDGITYRLVVQQKEKKLKRIKVSIKIDVVGVQDGKEVTISLENFDDQLEQSPITTEFKYFHVVEGILAIPLGFQPRVIAVSLMKVGVSSSQVERQFDWRVNDL